MRIFSTLFTAVLLLQTISAVKTVFDDLGNPTIVDMRYDSSYPKEVTAPVKSDGPGPKNDPYPAPHTFEKKALLKAHELALKMVGINTYKSYPKIWNSGGGIYMEFPILTSGKLWDSGDPGRFRLLYKHDNTFFKVAVHMSKESGGITKLYGEAVTKHDIVARENGLSGSTDLAWSSGASGKPSKPGRSILRMARSIEA